MRCRGESDWLLLGITEATATPLPKLTRSHGQPISQRRRRPLLRVIGVNRDAVCGKENPGLVCMSSRLTRAARVIDVIRYVVSHVGHAFFLTFFRLLWLRGHSFFNFQLTELLRFESAIVIGL
jgi:hypothetical protein